MITVRKDGIYTGDDDKFAGAYSKKLLEDHREKTPIDHPDGSITDEKIGKRTITTPSGTKTDTITGFLEEIYDQTDSLKPTTILKSGGEKAITSGAVYLALDVKEDAKNKVTALSDAVTDEEYPSARCVRDAISQKEDVRRKVGLLSNASTDNEYPSAKCVYDEVSKKENVKNKVSVITMAATHEEYPSAKSVLDALLRCEYTSNRVQDLVEDYAGDKYPSAKCVREAVSLKEDAKNKVTELTESSSDEEYPSAKCVYDAISESYPKAYVIRRTKTGMAAEANDVSPLSHKAEIALCPKNLATKMTGYRTYGASPTVTVVQEDASKLARYSMMSITNGETYTISKTGSTDDASSFRYFWFNSPFEPEVSRAIGGGYVKGDSATITAPPDADILFVLWTTNEELYPSGDVQCEVGSTRTSYVPLTTVNFIPVKISGKNLMPSVKEPFSVGGITFTEQDGVVIMNGSSTGEILSNNSAFMENFSLTLMPGTYTFTAINTSGSDINSISVRKINADGEEVLASVNGLIKSRRSVRFTITEKSEVYLGFYIYGRTFTKAKFKFQIESGDSFTGFEEYKGQTATSDMFGKVNDIDALSPNMIVTAEDEGVVVGLRYIMDINKVIK